MQRSRPNVMDRVEAVSWPSLRDRLRREWEPGQHAAIIAPTGSGKTFLAVRGLLPLWPYHLVIDVKGEDSELDRIKRKLGGYPSRPFTPGGYRVHPVIKTKVETRARLHQVFERVWADSRKEGGWAVYLDELRLVADQWGRYFNLTEDIERFWLQGRSRRITVIAGTQAPRWVPPAFYEQSRWHFIFRVGRRAELARLREISSAADEDVVLQTVAALPDHTFLVVDPKGGMVTSKVTP